MLKASFFDMDETLCDTRGAKWKVQALMEEALQHRYRSDFAGDRFSEDYVAGIYRKWQGGRSSAICLS